MRLLHAIVGLLTVAACYVALPAAAAAELGVPRRLARRRQPLDVHDQPARDAREHGRARARGGAHPARLGPATIARSSRSSSAGSSPGSASTSTTRRGWCSRSGSLFLLGLGPALQEALSGAEAADRRCDHDGGLRAGGDADHLLRVDRSRRREHSGQGDSLFIYKDARVVQQTVGLRAQRVRRLGEERQVRPRHVQQQGRRPQLDLPELRARLPRPSDGDRALGRRRDRRARD